MSEAARRLIPYPFQTAGEQHRATVSALIIMQTARDQARIAGLDAGRALHFGWRTNGAGGRAGGPGVIGGGHFSESSVGVTRTIVTRKAPVVTDDHPTAPYIENIGVRPDIYYDYMTRENLMTGGRPFVEAFTSAMVEHIRRNR